MHIYVAFIVVLSSKSLSTLLTNEILHVVWSMKLADVISQIVFIAKLLGTLVTLNCWGKMQLDMIIHLLFVWTCLWTVGALEPFTFFQMGSLGVIFKGLLLCKVFATDVTQSGKMVFLLHFILFLNVFSLSFSIFAATYVVAFFVASIVKLCTESASTFGAQ